MKKNLKVTILAILIFIVSTLCIKVEAASASISASKLNATVGDNITITVSMNAAAWNTKLTGAVNKNFAGNSDDGENTNKTETVTFTPSSAGTYTINLGGDVSDGSTMATTNVSGSVTITVAEKVQEQPTQPTEPAKPVEKTPTFSNANKTMYTTGGCNLRSSWSTSSAATYVEAGTELTVTGTSSEKVNGYVWYRVNYGGTKYIANFLLTDTKPEEKKEETKEEEKSTNKALKGLVVENHKLSPEFDPEITKYTLEVTKDVDKLEITPILQDEKSKYEIIGNDNLKVGNNIVKITVTAEDGTNRIYTITVTKTNLDGTENPLDNMLKLGKLQIKDIKLDPEFKPETTTYSILVADPSSIKISDITAVAQDKDVDVTIAEAEADKNGNRVITIMLENKDRNRSGVYQVTIKKGVSAISELQKNKNNRIYFILGGIIGILAIAIIVVIVLLKKTSNEEDLENIKDADELSDDYDYALKKEIDKAKSETATEFDELIEDSNVKSQIISNQEENNIFEDEENSSEEGIKESNLSASEETKRYDFNSNELEDDFDSDELEEDFKIKGKKKGKHF